MATTLTRRRTAPGPKGHFIMGSLGDFRRDPPKLVVGLQRDYGEFVRYRMGPYIVHQITDPECLQHVMVDNVSNYVRGKFYENFKLFFGLGLLTIDGAMWKKHRRAVQPSFHRHVLNAAASNITDISTKMIERWSERARQQQSFDVVGEMLEVSLNVLSKIMFSMELARYSEKIGPAMCTMIKAGMATSSLEQMIPLWIPTAYNRAIVQAQNALHEEIDRIIHAHKEEDLQESKDVVNVFLSMLDAPKPEECWTHGEIRDELATIFLAGHETTGEGLAWTLYALAQNPEICRKLEDELERVLCGRVPTVDDLPNLPYLRQVVDESLRLHPPVWGYPRDAVKDDVVGGYDIPAGSSILITPYASHRNPKYWENAEVFDPERFTPERVAGRPRYAYFPFGGGQRQCLGDYLGLLQLLFITAQVIQHFRLYLVPGQTVGWEPVVTLRPAPGIQITLESRERNRAVPFLP